MITVLMPMAGLGARFAEAGETRPKPMIPVCDLPMFRLALHAVRVACPEARLVCMVLEEHQRRAGLADLVAWAEPAATVVILPHLTGGPLQTCLAAEPHVDALDYPLVVLDCDLTFVAPAYFARLRAMAAGADDSAGLLLSFRSTAPHYSFAETRGERVVRTAEKQAISDRALLGAYGFGAAATFFAAAHDVVARDLRVGNGEFYVSSAFNKLIESGQTVRIVDAERHWSMGTPAALAACLGDPDFVAHAAGLAR